MENNHFGVVDIILFAGKVCCVSERQHNFIGESFLTKSITLQWPRWRVVALHKKAKLQH